MKKVKITVMKKVSHDDLISHYENRISDACNMELGASFISENCLIPEGFCESAWQNLYPYVMTLSCGGEDIHNGWMKDKNTAMISCNDGFRPVSFYLEAND